MLHYWTERTQGDDRKPSWHSTIPQPLEPANREEYEANQSRREHRRWNLFHHDARIELNEVQIR